MSTVAQPPVRTTDPPPPAAPRSRVLPPPDWAAIDAALAEMGLAPGPWPLP